MPKIDPITGCSVMTMPEFWNGEAASEGQGRTGGEVAADFYEEMVAEEQESRVRYFDHANLVSVVNTANEEQQKYVMEEHARIRARNPAYAAPRVGEDYYPWRVTAVLDLHEDRDFSEGMRGTSIAFKCKFRCDDGVDRWLSYYEESCGGSFYEPPSHECGVDIVTDPATP
jgi:hypothetical protein